MSRSSATADRVRAPAPRPSSSAAASGSTGRRLQSRIDQRTSGGTKRLHGQELLLPPPRARSPLFGFTSRQNVAADLGDLRCPGRAREPNHMAEGITSAVSRLGRPVDTCLPAVSDHSTKSDLARRWKTGYPCAHGRTPTKYGLAHEVPFHVLADQPRQGLTVRVGHGDHEIAEHLFTRSVAAVGGSSHGHHGPILWLPADSRWRRTRATPHPAPPRCGHPAFGPLIDGRNSPAPRTPAPGPRIPGSPDPRIPGTQCTQARSAGQCRGVVPANP